MKKEVTSKETKTVDGYLSTLPADVRKTLETVRKRIRSAAPKADELISYSIPAYKYKGWLVSFAAFKNHCGFYTTSHSLMKKMAKDLEGYDHSGVTIRFPHDTPLPATLIKKIIQERIRENEDKLAAKELATKKSAPKKK